MLHENPDSSEPEPSRRETRRGLGFHALASATPRDAHVRVQPILLARDRAQGRQLSDDEPTRRGAARPFSTRDTLLSERLAGLAARCAISGRAERLRRRQAQASRSSCASVQYTYMSARNDAYTR